MPLTMSKKSSTRTDNDNSTPKGVAAGKSKDRSNRDRSPSIFSRLRKKLKLYNKDKHAAAAAKASAMAAIQEPAIEEPVRLSAMLPNVMPASLSLATATNESPAMMSGAGNTTPNNLAPPSAQRPNRRSVVPQFSRIPTLSRMESERRERLLEYPPDNHNRSSSRDRRLGPIQQSAISVAERDGAYEVVEAVEVDGDVAKEKESNQRTAPTSPTSLPTELNKSDPSSPTSPASPTSPMARTLAALGPGPGPADSSPRITSASTSTSSFHPSVNSAVNSAFDLGISEELAKEMEWRWILNLSMHFRDESNREKFFVTYAQTTSLRRRLTISCDYRGAEEGTLEKELSMMKFQRDKSAKIYEAIRDSLGDIMFYETITNLKLQTSEGRLHVHVTEDINEIIPHPPSAAIAHLRCPKYRESELEFDSHLSGFVYKVKVGGEIMIKKEIPGPDTVDEFLYEINALYALADSDNVIQFGGCVIDDTRQKVKGLLISYASKGALIDILYNQKGHLPWERREKWAKQIVAGLSEIHEAGYVQGDFTLSNIVIDDQDNAKIIDINRRGCPVGWEPPEITAMIGGLQRIGMYIGVKSDIFQLGMVLWGMAHEQDEPEREARPLSMHQAPSDVPEWFQRIVESCLSDRPQGRPSAKDLLNEFPDQIVVSTPGGLPYLPGPPPITPGIPTDWRTANEYFPPTAYIPDQKLLLDGEPQTIQPRTSLPTTDDTLASPNAPQVIDAAPSDSDFDDVAYDIVAAKSSVPMTVAPAAAPMDSNPNISRSSLGGVNLGLSLGDNGPDENDTSKRDLLGGVRISAAEYVSLVSRSESESTTRAPEAEASEGGTVRTISPPPSQQQRGNGKVGGTGLKELEEDTHSGLQTPAFEDAMEVFTTVRDVKVGRGITA